MIDLVQQALSRSIHLYVNMQSTYSLRRTKKLRQKEIVSTSTTLSSLFVLTQVPFVLGDIVTFPYLPPALDPNNESHLRVTMLTHSLLNALSPFPRRLNFPSHLLFHHSKVTN